MSIEFMTIDCRGCGAKTTIPRCMEGKHWHCRKCIDKGAHKLPLPETAPKPQAAKKAVPKPKAKSKETN